MMTKETVFTKYKFISKERICNTMGWLDFNVINMYIGVDQLVKTGYCQYATNDVENNNVGLQIKYGEDDIQRKTDFKLSELGMFVDHFRNSKKIVPILKITDRFTNEPLDCDVLCFPAGKFKTDCIGYLIK